MATLIPDATDEQIRALRASARGERRGALVDLCDEALYGGTDSRGRAARAECARVIAEGRDVELGPL